MRIDAIQNGGVTVSPQNSSSHSLPKKNGMQQYALQQDVVSFRQGNMVKGGLAGTGFGLFAIGALSAVSGFAMSPLLCLLYAAAFGTAGGIAGKAHDDAERKLNAVA